MSTNSTIAAISTGLVNSGISIIKISGDKSLEVISKMFSNYKKLTPNKIIYGKIYNNEKKVMDDVLVSYFKAPNSYTGEDVCEINCHGGKQITLEILEEVLKNGAIMAKPGEFSKRAFINGKLDLSQAEAICNLIESKSKIETKIAINQLEGKLSENIKNIKKDLIDLLAQVEVSIDYPEYDYEELENQSLIDMLENKKSKIKAIIDTYDEGKVIKDGVNVAILGAPNVGKSSLLNRLANYEKAIVTDIPGTTRDIVDETININNLILNISDTAGIRNTQDIVEKIGVEKTIKKLDEVDLVLYLVSADQAIKDIDIEVINKIKAKNLKYLVVINKIDTEETEEKINKKNSEIFVKNMDILKKNGIINIVQISALKDIGINKLKSEIIKIFNLNDFDYNKDYVIVNKRHKDLLDKAYQMLIMSQQELKKSSPIDIVSISIKQAADYLGQIVGEDVSEDIINTLFKNFCIGK